MSDETPEIEEPKKPRRRRRSKSADVPAATEATSADSAARVEDDGVADDEATRAASSSGAASALPAEDVEASPADAEADEVDETPADVEAEEAAADVMLEAEAEIDEDSEPEEAPKPRRRRRGAAAKEPTPPAKPAPSRRRAKRDPNAPIPVVRAQAKYVRSSARKARLVCDHIRGKSVEEARAILAHTPRAIAQDWSKLLESAVANAEHNHELVGEDLYVKAIRADEGPTIKRFRPRAMGRATKIRKRTSHLTILLTPKE